MSAGLCGSRNSKIRPMRLMAPTCPCREMPKFFSMSLMMFMIIYIYTTVIMHP